MFEVGDKVRRIMKSFQGCNPGDEGVVRKVVTGSLWLDGSDVVYDDHYFTLVGKGYKPNPLKDPTTVTQAGTESDPNGLALSDPGAKADAGKMRPTLVIRDMANALEAVIKIATDGAFKYTAGGWLLVSNGEERYEDADLRHMLKRFKGEATDKDSNSLHLAHEAWNALAKLELHLRNAK